MLLRVFFCIALLSGAWQVDAYVDPTFPTNVAPWAAACIGTACLAGATLAQDNSPENTAQSRELTIDANVPSMIRTVRDNRKILTASIQQLTGPSQALQQVYSPALEVRLPSDVRGAVRDEASSLINGDPVNVKISSKKGSLTVQAESPAEPFGTVFTKSPTQDTTAPVNPKARAVDADIRSLVQMSFGNRNTLLSTAQQVTVTAATLASLVSPSVSVELPSDFRGAARDVLSGEVSALVNGNPVGMTILPQDDLLTVAIQSPLLPRLPLLESTSSILAVTPATPFWEQAFAFQPAPTQFILSNKNVAGGSALALGVLYGSSYGYYQYLIAEQEAEAQRKREEIQAKKKQAVAAKKAVAEAKTQQQQQQQEETVENEIPVLAGTLIAMDPEEALAVEKAREAVEKAKLSTHAAREADRIRQAEGLKRAKELEAQQEEEEEEEEAVPRKRHVLRKFWRWMKRDYVAS